MVTTAICWNAEGAASSSPAILPYTDGFAHLRPGEDPAISLIVGIGSYEPWIRSHRNPEQAVAMANMVDARFILPAHHQTFKLELRTL